MTKEEQRELFKKFMGEERPLKKPKIRWIKLIFALLTTPILYVLMWRAGYELVVIGFIAFSLTMLAVQSQIKSYIK